MPRIGIDARLYGVGSGTGIGRYTAELLRELSRAANFQLQAASTPPPLAPPPSGGGETETTEFVVFLKEDSYAAFHPPNERWTKVLADFRPYTWGVQTAFPRLIRNAHLDLMHFTHFDHPIRCPVPFIITIHDLILLDHRSMRATTLGPLRFWMKYAAYRRTLHHAVTESVRILTPSQTVKEQMAGRFGVLREKIIATPLGVGHVAHEQGHATWDRVRFLGRSRSLGMTEVMRPYALYVGNAYPHKNLKQLIRVMPALRKHHSDFRLVLAGREDDFYHEMESEISPPKADPPRAENQESGGERGAVMFFGPATEEERTRLVSNAAAYVSPSLAEGFDLPTLEAAALGTPVVATDIPVHREVLGDAFLPFPPHDDAALVDAIHRVLVHSELRATLVDRGIARARRFSWRTCALQTLSAYREILAFVDVRGKK